MSAESYNQKQMDTGKLTWEMITEVTKLWQLTHGLAADGYFGPNTQQSVTAAMTPPPYAPSTEWEPWDGPLARQPKNRTQVYEMFGNPGSGTVNPAWQAANIIELHDLNKLPGVPSKWYVKLHKDIEPYAREGLRRAQISSKYEIVRFGGFVFRHVQYNSKNPLSYHSWGIAFDVDADRNYAKTFAAGTKPVPWSPEWMKIWPSGVDQAFVHALASCGFTWGGSWSTFVDPMHFEWTGSRPV